MKPIQLFDAASSTYTYILFDQLSRDAVLVDPVDAQFERDQAVLAEYGLTLRWTLQTHVHAENLAPASAQAAAPAGSGIWPAPVQLGHGDVLQFGAEKLTALHTPGHTAGSLCFCWQGHVLTGDTLLIGSCGRTDFQSGDATALFDSLTRVLLALPPQTMVWPGHDYRGRRHSTIGHEKASNPRLVGKTCAEFVDAMTALAPPAPQRKGEPPLLGPVSNLRHDADAVNLMQVRPAQGYAGDVSPQLACQWFLSGEALLVDVRTDAERDWVGFVPNAVHIPWKVWPGMSLNPEFEQRLGAVAAPGQKVVLLCRSGIRSIAAARRATEALGLKAYNILEGFEGDPDVNAHRGAQGGWRFHGLPWRQN